MAYFKCRKCAMHNTSRCVSGEGDIKSGLFIIGQCPGADEERIGRPFVGRSGELLDIILKYSGIDRKNIYITNLVHCNPENNRSLKRSEISACSFILQKELDIGKPKVIIALGRDSIEYLTSISSVGKARSKNPISVFDADYKIIATYHPSFILRNGKKVEDVKIAIDDFITAKNIWR